MFRIWKEFHFSASHILMGLPDGHPCGRLHGHNYRVQVELESKELTDEGFVRDYGELRFFKEWIDEKWDHRHLNEFMNENPTAEHMARKMFYYIQPRVVCRLRAVRVSETPKTWAEFSEDG